MDDVDDIWFTNVHIPDSVFANTEPQNSEPQDSNPMDDADDIWFSDAHIPNSIFTNVNTQQSPNKDLSMEGQDFALFLQNNPAECSWNMPCSFTSAFSSTPATKHTPIPKNQGDWNDAFQQFVKRDTEVSLQLNESFDNIDQIMLELSHEYPLPTDLDDGTSMQNEIENEFKLIQERLSEVEDIYTEYYNRDPSISVTYNEIEGDFIICPEPNWENITNEDP